MVPGSPCGSSPGPFVFPLAPSRGDPGYGAGRGLEEGRPFITSRALGRAGSPVARQPCGHGAGRLPILRLNLAQPSGGWKSHCARNKTSKPFVKHRNRGGGQNRQEGVLGSEQPVLRPRRHHRPARAFVPVSHSSSDPWAGVQARVGSFFVLFPKRILLNGLRYFGELSEERRFFSFSEKICFLLALIKGPCRGPAGRQERSPGLFEVLGKGKGYCTEGDSVRRGTS